MRIPQIQQESYLKTMKSSKNSQKGWILLLLKHQKCGVRRLLQSCFFTEGEKKE
jgi:hypothetical protein